MTNNTHQDHSAGTGGPNGNVTIADDKKNHSGHWKSQELHLIDIFGKPLRLTYDEITTILLDRWMGSVILLSVLVLYAIDPHGYRGHMAEYWALAIWMGATVVFIALRSVTYGFFAFVQSKGWIGRLYTPAVSVAEYVILFSLVAWVSYAVAHDDYQFNFAVSFPFLLFVFVMLESFFIRFVIPPALARTRGEADATETVLSRTDADESHDVLADQLEPKQKSANVLALPDRNIRLETLKWMRSEEHYVHVHTCHEVITLRAKLPDLLEQIPPECGVRCHRSWWVSRVAEPTMKKGAQGVCLVTSDGNEVPIARSRKKEVQDWIDHYRDW